MPPDVRKGYRPSGGLAIYPLGYAPQFGAQPHELKASALGGAKPPPHIKRHSRTTKIELFHHSQLYFNHRATSGNEGRLPYISTPTR
jgi:hypothetical protein